LPLLLSEEVAAVVVGREIRKILQGNAVLLQRIQAVLAKLQTEKEGGVFIRAIMAETGKPDSEVIGWLGKVGPVSSPDQGHPGRSALDRK
jgi:hypothetical protein